MYQPDMNKPAKPTIEQLRAWLNRLFTRARKLAANPEELKALNEQERLNANLLLDKLMRDEFGDDEWIRRA
jgi:hypothetical protein